ncbi:alpha/beta fold hydrolase [Pseudotenacibaculum haliotis]|uniref:Alpha/beta fold hydrolase n=1 Tax=Pseudotenacibaculum haliotis TaxID=1862138 RepID=A0ABW5LU68_9FLAO
MYTYQEHLDKLHYYTTPEGKMAYLDEGKGEVILLLHGVPTSSWLYRKMIPLLTNSGYRVIAPDMLGYGASDKPNEYEVYSDEHMGRRLLSLMDHLNIHEWTHVFHDGGGLYTWAMLQQDPSKVKQLIMLNTIVYQEGFRPPLKFAPGRLAKVFAKQYSTSLGQKIVLIPTFKNGIDDKSVITEEMLEGYRIPFLYNGQHGLYYFFTQTCRKITDYRPLHQSLDIPLTVIWGKHDTMLVWKHLEKEVMSIFNIQPEDIHLLDAKHFIQEECPVEIAEIILNKMK